VHQAGEQQRDDAAYEQGDLLEGANNRPVNANALRILNELRAYREQLDQAAASDARRTTRRAPLGGKGGSAAEPPRRGESLDGFSLYLLGVVYNDLDNKERAAQALIESVCAYPYNWSAWLLLATVAPDATVIDQVQQSLDLSDAAAGTMLQLFAAHTLLAHQQNEQARQLYEELMQTFPSSTYVRGQIGLSYYNVRGMRAPSCVRVRVRACACRVSPPCGRLRVRRRDLVRGGGRRSAWLAVRRRAVQHPLRLGGAREVGRASAPGAEHRSLPPGNVLRHRQLLQLEGLRCVRQASVRAESDGSRARRA
jgi:tetratricopeptide (TPR) repeat protein